MSDLTTRKCFDKLLARSVERAQAELDRSELEIEGDTEIAKLIRIEQADRQMEFAHRVAELDSSIRDARLRRLRAAVDLVHAILVPFIATCMLLFGAAAGSGATRTSFFVTAVALVALRRRKDDIRRGPG